MFQDIDVSNTIKVYTGGELTPNYFRERDSRFNTHQSTIAYWDSATNVQIEHMKDIDDVRQGLSITGDRMQHFIIEIKKQMSPLELVLVQRMFTRIVVDYFNKIYALSPNYHLQSNKKYLWIDGNDVYLGNSSNKLKFSVSIATPYSSLGLIHFAYNIVTSGAPINICSLETLNFMSPSRKSRAVKKHAQALIKEFVSQYVDCVEDGYKFVC